MFFEEEFIMSDLLLSIIVPVYNVEKHLGNCLDSIISSCDQCDNIEILLVNDGATDNSSEICDEYSKNHSYIFTINKTNGGLASARNAGLEAAKGQYVTFIDSDDYLSEGYINEICNNLNGEDVIAFSNIIDYVEYGTTQICEIAQLKNITPQEAVKHLEKAGVFNMVWNKVYSSRLLKENNILFEINSEPGEDLLFNCKCFKNSKEITLIHKPYYHWVRRGEDTLANRFRKNLFEKVKVFIDNRNDLYSSLDIETTCKDELYTGNLNYIFTCIPNMYRKGHTFARKNRLEFYDSIINMNEVDQWIKGIKPDNSLLAQFCKLYKIRSKYIMDFYYLVVMYFRNHFVPIYNMIKRKS